jgi:hypothetical protein
MKNQLFKSFIEPTIIWEFFKENCEEQMDYYIYSKTLYKKSVFKNAVTPFIQRMEPYYHESKKHYATRKMDYAKFITIIRQICNSLDIGYTTQLIYNNSTYEIVYYIYKSPSNTLPIDE